MDNPNSIHTSGDQANDPLGWGSAMADSEFEAEQRAEFEARQRAKFEQEYAQRQMMIENLESQLESMSAKDREEAEQMIADLKSENINLRAVTTAEKSKKNKTLRGVLIGAATVVALSAAFFLGSLTKGKDNQNVNPTNSTTYNEMTTANESINPYAGELENGVTYDYTEYSNREEKEYYNAFGKSVEYLHDDESAMKAELIKDAAENPEQLASLIKEITRDYEQELLGIAGMSKTELEEYMSNPQNKDGGELQQRLIKAAEAILNDSKIVFSTFTGVFATDLIYKTTTLDGDNTINPQNAHLAQDRIAYEDAKGFEIMRQDTANPTKAGEWVTIARYVEDCGPQPIHEELDPDMPVIDHDKPVESTTPSTGPTTPPETTTPETTPVPTTTPPETTPPETTPVPTTTPPETTPEPTEPGTHPAKNTEAESQYAGDVTPGTVNPSQANSAEEAERIAEQNRREAEEQARRESEDAQRAAEEAAKQKAAEEAAKREAAARAAEQAIRDAEASRAAAEAESRAAEEAYRQQLEAAEAESRAAEEEAARQAAQEAANRAAEEASSEAAETGNADDRAGQWSGGGF